MSVRSVAAGLAEALAGKKGSQLLQLAVVAKPAASLGTLVKFVSKEQAQAGAFVDSLPAAARSDFKAEGGTCQLFYPPNAGQEGAERLLLVGLGEEKDLNLDSFRKATYTAVAALRKAAVSEAHLLLPDAQEFGSAQKAAPGACTAYAALPLTAQSILDAVCRTSVLSNHSFNKYKKEETVSKTPSLTALTLIQPGLASVSQQQTINAAQVVSASTVLARELANDRADVVNPSYLQNIAKQVCDTHGLTLRVLGVEELHARGLHLLSAVGQAARDPPRIVSLEYKGAGQDVPCIAVVGKGVTYDTGGLNLKPTGFMEDMHMDMSGAAAVLGTMRAIASLKLKVNVVGVLALAENAIDSKSYKPHAIIASKKGSVEVSNTDAEGRLCLADAFTYVQEDYKPKTLLDLATLTGACVVALGESVAGMFSNSRELSDALVQAGRASNELVWPMPIVPEHVEQLKGEYSDFKSAGDRKGGACTAAAFLNKFIDEGVAWAHMDIAGPAMMSKQRDHLCVGGTGFGVQLLVEYLRSQERK